MDYEFTIAVTLTHIDDEYQTHDVITISSEEEWLAYVDERARLSEDVDFEYFI